MMTFTNRFKGAVPARSEAKRGRPSRSVFVAATIAFTPVPATALGNAASAFCVSRGGKVETVAGVNGSQRGVCVLPDGSRIDEWVYFRNTHRTTR